jgi:aminoglycoside 3-N-acetyltransferase
VVNRRVLADQLRELGVARSSILVVHTSFKAIAPVEGGPDEVIAALRTALGDGGTLMMPSMSDDDDHPFDVRATPCTAMGVVADRFWRQPGVARSEHPASFAAIGPLASAITAPHPLAPPHGIDSPVGRACALGGFVLLLGVGHSANTTLHLAESLALVPYRARKSCVVARDGAETRVEYDETDHCCERFARVDEWLGACGLQRDGVVGGGAARLVRAADVVRVAVEQLTRDPFAFLHPRDGGCAACAEAWASVP